MLKVALADEVEGTIAKAHQLIDLYKSLGVDKERVLIKVSLGETPNARADI
jgi:transaldolase